MKGGETYDRPNKNQSGAPDQNFNIRHSIDIELPNETSIHYIQAATKPSTIPYSRHTTARTSTCFLPNKLVPQTTDCLQQSYNFYHVLPRIDDVDSTRTPRSTKHNDTQ